MGLYTTYSILRELRLKNNLTQRDVGNVLGIRTNMYQKYEYGKLELPIKHAMKLGKLYAIDWWTLYEDEEN